MVAQDFQGNREKSTVIFVVFCISSDLNVSFCTYAPPEEEMS